MSKDNLDNNVNQEVNTEKELTNNSLEEINKKIAELKEIEEKASARVMELQETEKRIDDKKESIENQIKEIQIPAITEKELTNNSLEVKKELDKMTKVYVRIPIDERNPKDLLVPVTISGYTYQIKRGESVEVPQEVQNILIEAKYI